MSVKNLVQAELQGPMERTEAQSDCHLTVFIFVSVFVSVNVSAVPDEPEEGIKFPGNELEAVVSSWCWELNSGPLTSRGDT